jgi:hypothetical protein
MIGFREGCVHTKIVTLSETDLAVQEAALLLLGGITLIR